MSINPEIEKNGRKERKKEIEKNKRERERKDII